jgi:SHS2 domain-containing protein
MPQVGRVLGGLARAYLANDGPNLVAASLHNEARMGHYEVLETVALADCALEIEGVDLDDLFATAARALAELMVDPATLGRDLERHVDLAAPAVDLLLFDWLGELIALKDAEGAAFPEVQVHVEHGTPWQLHARLAGGRLHGDATVALRADPKAVTFHLFRVEPCSGGWRARVVIDT